MKVSLNNKKLGGIDFLRLLLHKYLISVWQFEIKWNTHAGSGTAI